MSKRRVIHWGTGATGRLALRFLIGHPDLELVGLLVSSQEKIGKDAGELCGLELTGIRATADLEAILALRADCLCYCGTGATREVEVANDIARFLRAGINVSTMSLISMFHPSSAPADIRTVLAQACASGGASFYDSGVEPGFMSGQMVVAALACAGSIRKLTVTEFGNPGAYAVEAVARQSMGFGMPRDYIPPRFTSGKVLIWWRPVVEFHAGLIGARLDDIRFVFETAVTDISVPTAFGGVEAGTIGGTLWEVQGIVAGRPAVILRHVSFIHKDVAPHWPAIPAGTKDHAYVIEVDGLPSYRTLIFPDNDAVTGIDAAMAITATHIVNAIPSVCDAPPGLLDQRSVGPYVGRDIHPMLARQ